MRPEVSKLVSTLSKFKTEMLYLNPDAEMSILVDDATYRELEILALQTRRPEIPYSPSEEADIVMCGVDISRRNSHKVRNTPITSEDRTVKMLVLKNALFAVFLVVIMRQALLLFVYGLEYYRTGQHHFDPITWALPLVLAIPYMIFYFRKS